MWRKGSEIGEHWGEMMDITSDQRQAVLSGLGATVENGKFI